MEFEEGLVTQGRYPEGPIHVQSMERSEFKVGDAVVNKTSGGSNVFIIKEPPYKFVYARRPPPEPFYIDWFARLDNDACVSTSILRLATAEEIKASIQDQKRRVADISNRITNLERCYERTLN